MSQTTPFSVKEADHSLGFLLWKTTTIWQRLVKKALGTYKISHAQFVLMASLYWFHMKEKKLTQVDLIQFTKLDKMTVSSSLKKLVERGFVSRVEDQEDTRAKVISLTQKGRKLTRKLVPIVEKVDQSFFLILQKNEEREFGNFFRKILGNI